MAEIQAGQQPNAQPQDQQGQDTPAGGEGGEAPKTRVYDQKEMDRITAKVRANAAREAELKVRRELQAQPPAAPAAAPKNDEPPKDEAPKREAFSSYEDFVEAKAAYAADKAARAVRAEEKEEERKAKEAEAHKSAEQTWHVKIKAAIEKAPDFQTVMADSEELLGQIHRSPMRAAIVETDIGPLIVHDLCKNPAEAKRILALPAYRQVAEIAKIEDKLLAAAGESPKDEKDPADEGAPENEGRERNEDGTFKSEEKKAAPKGPPEPIEPGSGRPANASSKPSDRDSADEWRRKRTAEVLARQKGNLKTG